MSLNIGVPHLLLLLKIEDEIITGTDVMLQQLTLGESANVAKTGISQSVRDNVQLRSRDRLSELISLKEVAGLVSKQWYV